ncbi:MAG TPA: hypothetical protein VFV38_02685 [Ktedonobacteraceae bacterium]|nr:hypothetical protein [Ktedonobacteraceae bacterium]
MFQAACVKVQLRTVSLYHTSTLLQAVAERHFSRQQLLSSVYPLLADWNLSPFLRFSY